MPGTLTIHYGKPGTGKSYFAMADIIIPCAKEGRPFFTNITGISLSAISYLAGVHQSFVKYYYVKDIHDVIKYFDDDEICHNGVFILDEMKDFVNDEKAISWLESRINVMRKQTVDFVLIAQLPEKEYIHPHLMELAENCNVYVNRKKYGDTSHREEYKINGGIPRIVNDVPVNSPSGKIVRVLKPEIWSCYKTSESKFYDGAENSTFRGTRVWQTKRFKLLCLLALVVLVTLGFVIYGIYSLSDMRDLSGIKTNQNQEVQDERIGKIVDTSVSSQTHEEVEGVGTSPCFSYIVCDNTMCETDLGIVPTTSYNDYYGTVVHDGKPVHKCKGVDLVPNGGRLLRTGDKVPGDT